MRTTPRHVACVAALCAALVAAPTALRADSDTHYQDYLVGDRAAGMGGAFIALANEATGAYYNPAGIISEGSTMIQLSMSAYKLRHKEVLAAELCGTEIRDDDSGFFGFPGSLGFAQQFRTGSVYHAVGLTVVVPHWDRAGQVYTDADKQIQCDGRTVKVGGSEMTVDRVFWGGLTYAIKPWRFLQLGATLGVTVRSYSYNALFALGTTDKNALPVITFANYEASVYSLLAQLGVIVEPLQGLRLGLSLTTPSARLGSGGHLELIQAAGLLQDTQNTGGLVLDDLESHWKMPFALGLGAAYNHPRFTVALDVTLHGSVARYAVMEHQLLSAWGLSSQVIHNQREVVVNVNLGGELRLSRLDLRAGLFTNLSSYPGDEQLEDFDHVQKVGFSLGGSFRSNKRSALSLALQGQYGRLKTTAEKISIGALNRPSSETFTVEATDLTLIITVGGSLDIR